MLKRNEGFTSCDIPDAHSFIETSRNEKIGIRVVIKAKNEICVPYQSPCRTSL